MSFVFEKPRSSIGDTFAGGAATVGEIYTAARDNMLYVDNTFASQWALDRAITERNDEVFKATGVRPEMPFGRLRHGTAGWRSDAPDALAKWQRDVSEAAARIPDQNVAARLNRSIEGDAIRIARESDERLAQVMGSRGGASKWIGALAGGFSGSMRDPINVLSLFVGGGPGAARTIAGRIVATAAKEAFVNGATEAAMQPTVQAWREKAGLDHGMQQALANIGFAAAFGGIVGGAGRSIAEAAGKLSGRALEAAGDAAASDARVAEPLRRAMGGDIEAARQVLPEIHDSLPAEARGALDQVETIGHLDASRPRSIAPEQHDLAVSAAHRSIDTGTPPAFEVDQAQVARIVNDMIGDAPAPAMPRARSLSGFLIDAGGVQDFQGELAAIGAGTVSERFRGRLVREGGMPLDRARELAEEAGYIGRAGETQITSVSDLLDALDEDLRGNSVFSREDGAQLDRAADLEAERAGLERTVAEVAHLAGPGVDDAIVHQAAKLSIEEGLDPGDALERVYMQADGEAAPAARAARSGDPMPGWSDAELEAASAARGPEPEAGFFPDPAKVDPEFQISPADIEQFGGMDMPGEDGRVVSLADYMDDITHGEDLAAIVKACKS